MGTAGAWRESEGRESRLLTARPPTLVLKGLKNRAEKANSWQIINIKIMQLHQ